MITKEDAGGDAGHCLCCREGLGFDREEVSVMALSTRLELFLRNNRISFSVLPHRRTETALGTAVEDQVPAVLFAKVVMVKAEGRDVMIVLPAPYNLDLLKLENALNTEDIKVDHEHDFETLFPDCEPGAMPPFGLLYGLPCYIDFRMLRGDRIYFNGGDHEESVGIATEDFLRSAKVTVVDVVAA